MSAVNPFAINHPALVDQPLNNDAGKPDSGDEQHDEIDQLQQQLQKKPTRGTGKKKNLFKNPGFLGFEINKSIDDQPLEPRTFKKQAKYEQKFNGFD